MSYLFELEGALLRLDVDIEEVRQRLAALFAPYAVTGPFRPIVARIPRAAREAAARGGDPAALERAGFAILSEWEVRGAASARPADGAQATVAALAARGHRLGVVTDRGRACVVPALRAAGLDPGTFRAIVSRDDVLAPRPEPAAIVAGARTLGAGDVWYVGAHPADLQAALAARTAVPGLRIAIVAAKQRIIADGAKMPVGADRILSSVAEVLEA